MKKIILIDAHAVIHRAYHALPPLTAPSGEPINAVYGFTTILLRILRELKPDYIAAAFDLPGPTFRHIAYERYKAQRPETPNELSSQFSKVKEILEAFGIAVFEKEGYEADDIIGTIAKKLENKKGVEIIVVTGDMDALQLVGPRLKVYSMKKGITETVIYDEKAVYERYGFGPRQLVDFKGLKGDPSDNIPGVKGIGEKTATELIKNFGSVEGIYKALKKGNKKISESVAERLRDGEEDAKFSKELATVNRDAPIKFDFDNIRWRGEDKNKIRAVFQKFGFFSLLKKISQETGNSAVQSKLPSVSAKAVPARAIRTTADFKKFLSESKDFPIGLTARNSEVLLIFDSLVWKLDENLLKEREVRNFFENNDFFAYDGKTLLHFLRKSGIELGGIKFDIMVASYLTGSFTRDFSYFAIANRELGRMLNEEEEFAHFFEIVSSLEKKLAQGKLRDIFLKIEIPMIKILADMEDRGVLIDRGFLKLLAEKVDKKILGLVKEIHELAGEDFNINSSRQLSKILFEKLKIKTYGLRKTEKGGVVSTRESELKKLKSANPIIGKIIDYRELMKLKTTYIDVLPDLVEPESGRVHTTFNQTVASTGRLSSSDPNLQNIPIMSEIGREIRKAFIAGKGFAFVSFDYSQIELRVAAHIAGDEKMIEAFKEGLDIHKMTASEIYNVPLEKVTPDLRRAAKTLNFGILYGMGPQALAEATDMSLEEAREFIREYFHDFPKIKDYIEKTKRFAEENGYVETIFGRRRYIPEIHSPNWQMKREAERMAVNMPIQGTATGDIIKMAMIKIDEWIKKEKLEDSVKMLLQVHDELVFEIKKDSLEKAAKEIKKIMESVAELKVPLVVDVKAGANWGEQLLIK